ncbi:integral membrane protein [Niveomyces insectorum RCEF 264]|uniref:Integral membrane protein n=1 Tax=Niveomyces insectorum RCEF 264 TaxID=1081102 RepID=A0A167NU92_9HYPO|nr:integral membrane protein [Niveomyces insectorum RCEF 264]
MSRPPSKTPSLVPPRHGRRTGWDRAVPPALRPLVRAYLLGYASSVAPRLLTVLLTYCTAHRRRRRRRRLGDVPDDPDKTAPGDPDKASLAWARASVLRILRSGLEWQRFPTFCAALVGGSTLLEIPFRTLLTQRAPGVALVVRARLARWLASFLAAYFSLTLLQAKQTAGFTDTVVASGDSAVPNLDGADVVGTETTSTDSTAATPTTTATTATTIRYAGRTLDLTLFARPVHGRRVRAVRVERAAGAPKPAHRHGALCGAARAGDAAAAAVRAGAAVAGDAVFAASTAIVFTAVQENPKRVRGVLGGILRSVLAP